MDAVSYSHSAKQAQRIEKFIKNPDSNSGIVTVPKVIEAGESVTVPAGRVAVLPNVQVDGELVVDGEVFIPSGATLSKVVELEGDQTIYDVKTFSSTITGSISGNSGTATKLATPRTINGVSFDGTANITVADSTKLPLAGGTLTGALTGTTFSGTSFNSITALSSTTPVVAGTAAVGTSTTVARADHVHPVQTSVTGSSGSCTGNAATATQTITTSASAGTPSVVNGTPNNSKATIVQNWSGAGYGGIRFNGTQVEAVACSDLTGTFSSLAPIVGSNITSGGNVTGNAATATTATNLSGGTVNATHVTATGSGNDYNTGGVELLGNGASNTVFPNIGFHQPGLYASSLQLRGGGDFRFYARGAGSYANVTASTFYGALSGNAATATNVAWSGVTSKPTTLSGYGITDAQATLVSGTNIKTINSNSILGSGDIVVGETGWTANDSRAKTALNASGTAPIYACRAWVNFNGTGTVAIRASGNVSSITDNGTGDYTVNFTTVMPDADYNYTFGLRTYQDGYAGYAPAAMQWLSDTQSTSAMRFRTMDSNQPSVNRGFPTVCVSIHR